MTARNPNYKEYVEFKISKNKFMHFIGFEITNIQPGVMEGELVFKELHEQQNGYLHGGVTSTLCDMVAGFAAYSLVEEGQQVFTVEAKVSYLNRGTADKYFAKGWVLKPGKRFHFCESEVYYLDKDEKIVVAKGSATMAVL